MTKGQKKRLKDRERRDKKRALESKGAVGVATDSKSAGGDEPGGGGGGGGTAAANNNTSEVVVQVEDKRLRATPNHGEDQMDGADD